MGGVGVVAVTWAWSVPPSRPRSVLGNLGDTPAYGGQACEPRQRGEPLLLRRTGLHSPFFRLMPPRLPRPDSEHAGRQERARLCCIWTSTGSSDAAGIGGTAVI